MLCLWPHVHSAVNKFWSRRPHWKSRRQPTFRVPKARVSWGSLGACPPENFEIKILGNAIFNVFQTVFGPEKQSKLCYINHILCLLQPFVSSKSQSLVHRKEWNDKSSNADSKNTFNVLSSCSPFERTCSAMSASVSLAQMPFWQMRKPGI